MPVLSQKYFHDKGFDQKKLDVGIAAFMVNEPLAQNHTSDSAANLAKIVNRLAVDARVTDIRWMAYMLATVTPESRELQAIQLELKNKDGTPKIDPKTKQPQTRTVNS